MVKSYIEYNKVCTIGDAKVVLYDWKGDSKFALHISEDGETTLIVESDNFQTLYKIMQRELRMTRRNFWNFGPLAY